MFLQTIIKIRTDSSATQKYLYNKTVNVYIQNNNAKIQITITGQEQ